MLSGTTHKRNEILLFAGVGLGVKSRNPTRANESKHL